MALILSKHDVEQLIMIDELIDVIARAQVALSVGTAIMPLRLTATLPESREQNLMPAWLGDDGFGFKSVTFFPSNGRHGLPAVLAIVVLLDPDTGRPLAIMDGTSLTALRTAAASAVATRALANDDTTTLALVGAGVQAKSHLLAMTAVRPIHFVKVAARTYASAGRFVAENHSKVPDVRLEPTESVREAVQEADLICTVTTSSQPVLKADWLRPGCHINAVGAHSPSSREIDSATMRTARVVGDSREAIFAECGDCLIPIAEGIFDAGHVSDEIGEVLAGVKPGRKSAADITVYQSCGLAVQDVAAAHLVYGKARAQGVGIDVAL